MTAKFAPGLIRRIFEHCLERGYVKKGDTVVDPFGGIGAGGIFASPMGLKWYGVELETKFVTLAISNFELHAHAWQVMGYPQPVILQGDSRRLSSVLQEADLIATSPPFAEAQEGAGIAKTGTPHGGKASGTGGYRKDMQGNSPGQIGAMKAGDLEAVIDGCVMSPPYANSIETGEGVFGRPNQKKGITQPMQKYGQTPGQIGAMKAGNIDGVVCSPPFAQTGTLDHDGQTGKLQRTLTGGGMKFLEADYGTSPGQIGRMKSGSIDAVIDGVLCSNCFGAEYETVVISKDLIINNSRATIPDIQCEKCPKCNDIVFTHKQSLELDKKRISGADAIITSPPYADSIQTNGHRIDFSKLAPGNERANYPSVNKRLKEQASYSPNPSNIGNLKAGDVGAVVTSPPFTQGYQSGGGINKNGYGKNGKDKVGQRTYQAKGGERTPGNIELTENETYWQAVRDVYAECYKILKPGGVIIIVVKSYIKSGRRVPLPMQTLKLLIHLGFEPLERIKASLVKETVTPGLFGEIKKTVERKSFFRRLHEKKRPDLKIDFEEILICRK